MKTILALAGLLIVALAAIIVRALGAASRRAERSRVSPEVAAYLEPIPEDGVPIEGGVPDLARLTGTVEHYADIHQEALTMGSGPGLDRRVCLLAYARRVMATWGLIARGMEAVPHAVELLRHWNPDAREDAAGILTWIGRDGEVVGAVIAAVEAEEEGTLARNAMVAALGRFGSRRAIPALGAVLRNDAEHPDIRWDAAVALGQVVRKRFDREGDAVENFVRWLDASSR